MTVGLKPLYLVFNFLVSPSISSFFFLFFVPSGSRCQPLAAPAALRHLKL
ncbi:hypothetical protein ASAC_0644 [Acidilobus saccharovorans 345-15]|uniref:Uncharacterized protein n=1 Tax=Acidilobus saccharovorans (strain DSM 16705 / JCM 18335 / VKM B-2471 / 345-15) TaxID=666510 RepID=D9Q162_ACIS3|nr:hypothetical protein ASAC_0644 [Acidilobus saccharovorans 345-15]